MLDPPPRRGPAYKTKLCVLWRRGSCPRGPSCRFAHGPGELRSPPPGSSSPPRPLPELASPSANRRRAREMKEMLDPPPRRGPAYKTKLCVLWRRGSCPRGPSCGFAHGPGELRSPPLDSSPPHPLTGRQGHRELRVRPERRSPPCRRYSSDRDARGNLFRDERPSSQYRGTSNSRSPIRKSERRHKKVDGEKPDSTGSLNSSGNEDRKKEDRHSSGDEKDDNEAQLKQIALDMKELREDKSKVQMKLDQKIDEAGIQIRVDDLESQLNKEKQDCERMTSKIKKLVKAHGFYVKAQEDLKRESGLTIEEDTLCEMTGTRKRKRGIHNLPQGGVLRETDDEEEEEVEEAQLPHPHKKNNNKKRKKKKKMMTMKKKMMMKKKFHLRRRPIQIPDLRKQIELGTRSRFDAKNWTCPDCDWVNKPEKYLIAYLPPFFCERCGFDLLNLVDYEFSFSMADVTVNGFPPIGNIKDQGRLDECTVYSTCETHEIVERMSKILVGQEPDGKHNEGPILNTRDLQRKTIEMMRICNINQGPNDHKYNYRTSLVAFEVATAQGVKDSRCKGIKTRK